jgi:AMP-binding enzyme C-terminal domain
LLVGYPDGENAAAAHPAVANCAVGAVPDNRWGERVHTVEVRKPDSEVTGAEIRKPRTATGDLVEGSVLHGNRKDGCPCGEIRCDLRDPPA